MPPQKRKYMDSVRYGNRVYKRSKPTAKDRRDARVTTVVRAPGPIPPRMISKMKYVQEISSNGTTIDHVFNLNSTFDPDLTGTGHQPYARDTYASLYNRYRVFAVRYKIFFSAGSSSVTDARGVLVWNNGSSGITNYGLAAEMPTSRTCVFGYLRPYTLSGRLSLNRITGVTRDQYKSDDRFQALASASPTEVICLHVIQSDATGTAIGSGLGNIRVELKYFVEWFDPLDLSQS